LALASCACSLFRETDHEFVQSNECEAGWAVSPRYLGPDYAGMAQAAAAAIVIILAIAVMSMPLWAPCWVFEYTPITAMPMRCLRGGR